MQTVYRYYMVMCRENRTIELCSGENFPRPNTCAQLWRGSMKKRCFAPKSSVDERKRITISQISPRTVGSGPDRVVSSNSPRAICVVPVHLYYDNILHLTSTRVLRNTETTVSTFQLPLSCSDNISYIRHFEKSPHRFPKILLQAGDATPSCSRRSYYNIFLKLYSYPSAYTYYLTYHPYINLFIRRQLTTFGERQ